MKATYVFVLMQASEGAYGRWLAGDVVCHELAHQWFGNYVTCQDFDNIAGRVTALSYLHDRARQLCHHDSVNIAGRVTALSFLHDTVGQSCY